MKTALLLIDIQNDYFPGGRMELEGPLQAAAWAGTLLSFFRENQYPTIHIQHVSTRSGATFFLPDTDGIQIHETIAPKKGELILTKHFPNSFRETNLLEFLKDLHVERLAISGMMTHMCVDATTRAAVDLGFPVMLAADACATRDLIYGENKIPAAQVHGAFLAALKSYGLVLPTSELVEKMKNE
jgi:nicotinamidase-related amidase